MASNDEYQHQNEWRYETKVESWMEKMIGYYKKKHAEEAERLFYTAQNGSLLDGIWNKTNTDGK